MTSPFIIDVAFLKRLVMMITNGDIWWKKTVDELGGIGLEILQSPKSGTREEIGTFIAQSFH